MLLDELIASKSRKGRKRVGRGPGSGTGGTAGRGHKGQLSRSGGKVKPWFEGGQMPLQRRLPKRGFTNVFKRTFQIVKVGRLERFEPNAVVDPEALEQAGLIRSALKPVKILSDGELGKPLVVRAHAFSAAAKEKIEKAGGSAEIIEKSASAEQAQGQEG